MLKKIVLFIIFVIGLIIMGLMEDPYDYEVDIGPPQPYEGYENTNQYIQDRILEDPEFAEEYRQAEEQYKKDLENFSKSLQNPSF